MEEIKESIRQLIESQRETDRLMKESQKNFEKEAMRRQEEADKEAKRRQEEAERRQKDAERRQEEADKEAKRRQEEAERRQEEAERRQEEAERRQEEAAERREEEAERREEEAERRQEEADKEAKRRQEEAERRQEEAEKEGRRLQREMERGFKRLDNLFTGQWGKLMEALVDGDLVGLLKGKGVAVEKTVQNIKKKRDGEQWQVDIVAINGDEVVVVEVKTTMKVRDVRRFVERTLGSFADDICPEYKDKKIYGAVAYLKEEEDSATYAEKQGLFVIRATGSSSSIVNGSEFTPKAF